MDKSALVAAILEKLREEFAARRAASMTTRATGNDPESRAENKYDTLSIEQNYLADGLARQARVALEAVEAFEKLAVRRFAPDEPIDLGALVEVAFPGATEWFFLGPAAGGVAVALAGREITVITPESPLGSQLLDHKAGDRVTAPAACIVRVE